MRSESKKRGKAVLGVMVWRHFYWQGRPAPARK